MDFNEAALKERFEAAVEGVSPDVGGLMDGGIERGAQLRRRQRAQVLGAAGVTAAAAAVVYSGFTSGLFDSNSTGPADPPDSVVVQEINSPATARSLTAAALEHLSDEQLIAAGGPRGGMQRGSVFASLALDTDQGKVQLDVVATTRVKGWDRQGQCAPGTPQSATVQCQRSTLDDGAELVVAAEKLDAGTGPAQYLVRVTARRDDQLVGVLEYLRGAQAAVPREGVPMASWDLPVDVETLQEIVSDPRFGVVTSPEMIAKGEALDGFTKGGTTTGESSSGAVEVAPPDPTNFQVGPGNPTKGKASTSAPKAPGQSDSSSGP